MRWGLEAARCAGSLARVRRFRKRPQTSSRRRRVYLCGVRGGGFPSGVVGTHSGPILSAADSMKITVFGPCAHGSMPQAAIDPVVLAAMIILRLQTIVAREIPPGEFAVLTVGSVQAGTKSNVIPDTDGERCGHD